MSIISQDKWVPQKKKNTMTEGGSQLDKSKLEDQGSRQKHYETGAWVVFLRLPAGQISDNKESWKRLHKELCYSWWKKCCPIPYQYESQWVSNSGILASTATLILSDVPRWRTAGPGAHRVMEWCVPYKWVQRPK